MKEIQIESTERAISFEQKKEIVLSYLNQEKDNTKNQAQELKQESDESNDKDFLNNIKQKIENLLVKYKDIKSKIQLLEDNKIEEQGLEELIEEYDIDIKREIETKEEESSFYLDLRKKLAEKLKLDFVSNFKEGLARVKKDNKWFYIDKSGNEITKDRFDNAFPFSEGLASVIKGVESFYIDKSGNEITSDRFDSAFFFLEGLASVQKDGEWFYIDKQGRKIFDKK